MRVAIGPVAQEEYAAARDVRRASGGELAAEEAYDIASELGQLAERLVE